jgi:hypothetical protein
MIYIGRFIVALSINIGLVVLPIVITVEILQYINKRINTEIERAFNNF